MNEENKRITELETLNFDPIEDVSELPQVWIPVADPTGTKGYSNLRVSLLDMFQCFYDFVALKLEELREDVTTAKTYSRPASSGEGSGSGGSNITTEQWNRLVSRVSSLENSVNTLLTSSTWPKHTITVTDGSTSANYELETRPNGISKSVLLQMATVEKPNFKLLLNVNNPTVTSSGTLDFNGSVVITASDSQVHYDGGTINSVYLRVSGSSGSSAFVWEGQKDIISSPTTITSGNRPYSYTLSLTKQQLGGIEPSQIGIITVDCYLNSTLRTSVTIQNTVGATGSSEANVKL